jgi:hypothetical protein
MLQCDQYSIFQPILFSVEIFIENAKILKILKIKLDGPTAVAWL